MSYNFKEKASEVMMGREKLPVLVIAPIHHYCVSLLDISFPDKVFNLLSHQKKYFSIINAGIHRVLYPKFNNYTKF